MDIKRELKLIREGVEDFRPVNEDGDFISQEMFEATYDVFIAETTIDNLIINESVFQNITFSALLKETAEAIETQDGMKLKGVFAKIKQKLIDINKSFSPYEGLKELKMVNETMADEKHLPILIFIPILGPVIFLMKIALKYDKMDANLMKQYLEEAYKFKKHLEKAIATAKSSGDDKKVIELKRHYVKLENNIHVFEVKTSASRMKQM